MKHPLWDALPRWLLTWLACVALNLGLGELLRVDSRWWLALLALLLWCGLLAVTERFGRFWGMLALWAAALGICLLLSDREALAEAALSAFSREGPVKEYGELALLLACATAALFLSALLRFYWMRAALSLGWLALWIAAALLEWPLPRLIPAALVPLLLTTLTETIRRIRREAEPEASMKRALILSLLPTALLLALLPAPAEPYDYPLLHSVAERVEQIWHDAQTALRYRFKGEGEFGLSFNGVSDEAGLGESAEENSSSIIFARPGQATDGTVYLFGNAWEIFDGQGWSSSLGEETAESLSWSLDTAEHVYALWRMLGEEDRPAAFSDYFRTNNLYLVCRNLNLRTMFVVMNAAHVFTDAKRFPYADAPTGSLFDYVQKEEVWYRVYYLESNTRTRDALIASAEGTVYNGEARGPYWSQVADDFGRSFFMDLRDDVNLERALARRAALIRSVYLDCSGVSDRAAALAEEITAGCRSDYEKTAAIAAYLQGNYRYTPRPDPVPKGENFLDWLLFEGREGYCTWYATAAVLLSRSVGVPARYVQGYRNELSAEGYTRFLPQNAHAWCECYIAGYGWVTVEATPGYGTEGPAWLTAEEERELYGDTPASTPAPEELPGGEEESEEDLPPLPSADGEGGKPGESAQKPEPAPARYAWLPALIPVVLPAALAAVWLGVRARRKRRYAQAEPDARLMMDLELLLRHLRGKGYPRKPEESLRQYFARLPWRYLLAREAEAQEMAELYDRTFFGQVTPSESDLAKHRTFVARFRPRSLRQWLIWLRLQ